MDRVISGTYNKVIDQMYLLTGKIQDIKRNAIVASETVNHDGDFATLSSALEALASQLKGVSGGGVRFMGTAAGAASLQGGIQRVTPRVSGNKSSGIAALFIDSIPSRAEVYFGNIKSEI